MGDLFNRLFGSEKKPGPRIPSPGAGTTTVGTSGTTVRTVPVDVPRVEDVGEAVVSRLVDPSASDFKILGRAELFGPGEPVKFFVQAISLPPKLADGSYGPRVPIPGLPVIVRNKAQARQLGPTVTTDEQGIAIVPYTVTEQDQKGDPSTPDPDTGSYLCNAYIGGRLLNKVVSLWDEW